MQFLILESALNYLITSQSIDTAALHKKNIRFEIENFPLEMVFVCTHNKIYVLSATKESTDVDIKLKIDVFLSLFQGKDLKQLLREDKIIVSGDVKTAQLLVDLLEQVDIDLEEALSKYTGDAFANEVGKLIKNIKQKPSGQDPIEAIKNKVTKLLLNPTKSKRYEKSR